MKTYPIYTKVKVTNDGSNASDFSIKDKSIPPNGIYGFKNWKNTIFDIVGHPKGILFQHNPNIFCAYPIGLDGKVLGWVYNTALEPTQIDPIKSYSQLLLENTEMLEALKRIANNYDNVEDLAGVIAREIIDKIESK